MADQLTWEMRARTSAGSAAASPLAGVYGVAETPAEYVVCRPKVYVDSSVPSYLTARLSRDPLKARCQQITREWWELCRWQFDVCWSEVVEHEIGRGNKIAAELRRAALKPFTRLNVDGKALQLAGALMKSGRLPPRAEADAKHIAIAATHRVDVLLTWNCTHLANPALTALLMDICIKRGYHAPQILTPQQLMGVPIHERRARG